MKQTALMDSMRSIALCAFLVFAAACDPGKVNCQSELTKNPPQVAKTGICQPSPLARQTGSPAWYKEQEEAAWKGDLCAQELIADCYLAGTCGFPKDKSAAAFFYERAAEQGSAHSQMIVAGGYLTGTLGFPESPGEAAKWYRRAAESGDPWPVNSLAELYDAGIAVPQNFAEAAKLYRQAAEMNWVSAQRRLGELYAEGRGVPQDVVMAHFWFNLACSNEAVAACDTRDTLAARMSPDQVAEAQRRGLSWKPKPRPTQTVKPAKPSRR
jgi:TPR repeat protein